jgi:hypothetical protein
MLPIILLCVAVIVLSVPAGKPYGWIALGLAVLALLAAVAGFKF